jgi:hypothetical protein
MKYCGLKAMRAFAFGVVMSGLAVACNEATQVAKTVAPEAEAVSASTGKSTQSAQLTAAEREAKKREFFAKPEVKEMSAGLEEIAEAVAVAVEDKDLRDRIYAKCMEKFDGETNVLWQQLEADNNLRAKGGWNKRVDDLVGKGRKNTVVKGVGNVDAAVKKFEKLVNAPLHLFWMYPSTWDKKTTPLVAFVPWDVDPDTRQSIPAFDSKGNRFELDRNGELAKKRPILVVAVNERVSLNGTRKELLAISHEDGTRLVTMQMKGKSPNLTNSTTVNRVRPSSVRIDFYGDELPWDGAAEFEYQYTYTVYDLRYGTTYTYGYTYRNVGWNATSFTFSASDLYYHHPLFKDSDYETAYRVRFTYDEDDGWDMFDDPMGYHEINVPDNPGTLTRSSSDDPSNSYLKEGSYTFFFY